MSCTGCCRIILLIFNLLLFIIGVAGLGIGIWVAVDGTILLNLLQEIPDATSAYGRLISDAAYIIIAAGAVIFIISFLGCCGAWKKNKCLLITYSVVLVLILLLEIGLIVVGYFFYDNVKSVVTEELSNALRQNYDSQFANTSDTKFSYTPGNLISKGVDALQVKFECCGVNNSTDYGAVAVPPTCCPLASGSDLKTIVNEIWQGDSAPTLEFADLSCPGNITYLASVKGCYDAIYEEVQTNSIIIMAVGGATLGLELLLIIIACCVARSVDKDD